MSLNSFSVIRSKMLIPIFLVDLLLPNKPSKVQGLFKFHGSLLHFHDFLSNLTSLDTLYIISEDSQKISHDEGDSKMFLKFAYSFGHSNKKTSINFCHH